MAVIAPLTLLLAGCASDKPVLPLPALPQGAIELRVAYAVNPRLPRMSPGQLAILLDALRNTAREHFGVELRFSAVEETTVAALFARIPDEKRREAQREIFDFKTGSGDPARLEAIFADALEKASEPLQQLIDYAAPYMDVSRIGDKRTLGARLARVEIERVQRWRDIVALDGKPSIDAQPYNEFNYWDVLGYGELPYELVLTNQLIASVEYVFPDLHPALRGGYNNGVTSYSRRSRFLTYSAWSTFGFASDDAWVKQLRGGEVYGTDEAARLAGIGAAHELGHQLFHLGHPYGQRGCIMSPPPQLAYRAWVNGLSAADCPIGSSKPMQPGAFQFEY